METPEHSDRTTLEERRALPARLCSLVRNNWGVLIVLACMALFLLLIDEVMEPDSMRIDRWAYLFFVQTVRSDWLTPVMQSVSGLATPVALIVFLLVIAAFAPGTRPGWCCALNLVLVTLLNVCLKALIQRPRPEGFRLVQETGFSFPSGHSMVAMAFFGLIIWLVWHYERNRRQRLLLCVAFSLVILLIGLSRIYLGVHYASDVIGGFCASLIWLAFYTRLIAPLFLGAVPGSRNPGEGGPIAE